MFDLRGGCRPGDSGESPIDESGSRDQPPKGEEVKKEMGKTFGLHKCNLVFCLSYKGGTFYE